jgi:hypothetical protein
MTEDRQKLDLAVTEFLRLEREGEKPTLLNFSKEYNGKLSCRPCPWLVHFIKYADFLKNYNI